MRKGIPILIVIIVAVLASLIFTPTVFAQQWYEVYPPSPTVYLGPQTYVYSTTPLYVAPSVTQWEEVVIPGQWVRMEQYHAVPYPHVHTWYEWKPQHSHWRLRQY